jgi:hypothetical protein
MASCIDIDIKFKKDATGNIVLDDINYGSEPTQCEIKDDEILIKNDVIQYDSEMLKRVIEKVKSKRKEAPVAEQGAPVAAPVAEQGTPVAEQGTPVAAQGAQGEAEADANIVTLDRRQIKDSTNVAPKKPPKPQPDINRIENPEVDPEAEAQSTIDEASAKKIQEAEEAMKKQEDAKKIQPLSLAQVLENKKKQLNINNLKEQLTTLDEEAKKPGVNESAILSKKLDIMDEIQKLEKDQKLKKLGGKRKTYKGGKKVRNVSKKVRFNMTKRHKQKRRGTRK